MDVIEVCKRMGTKAYIMASNIRRLFRRLCRYGRMCKWGLLEAKYVFDGKRHGFDCAHAWVKEIGMR